LSLGFQALYMCSRSM